MRQKILYSSYASLIFFWIGYLFSYLLRWINSGGPEGITPFRLKIFMGLFFAIFPILMLLLSLLLPSVQKQKIVPFQ